MSLHFFQSVFTWFLCATDTSWNLGVLLALPWSLKCACVRNQVDLLKVLLKILKTPKCPGELCADTRPPTGSEALPARLSVRVYLSTMAQFQETKIRYKWDKVKDRTGAQPAQFCTIRSPTELGTLLHSQPHPPLLDVEALCTIRRPRGCFLGCLASYPPSYLVLMNSPGLSVPYAIQDFHRVFPATTTLLLPMMFDLDPERLQR